jgi:hypothetical protein
MKNLMISLLVVAVTFLSTACGGSAGASAKANTADGVSSESKVTGTWISGQPSADATQNTNELGESLETGPLILAPQIEYYVAYSESLETEPFIPAQPTTSNRALPPECGGKMPPAQKMAQGTLVCRCESAGHEAVWSTFVWDTDAYPNCKVPYPDQVLTRAVNRPFVAPGDDDPYKDSPTPVAKVESTAVTSATSSRTQVTCDSRMDGEKRVATCMVAKDNQPAQSFTCVGPGVKNLTVAQKLAYNSGPPCTCETGSPQPLGASVPNTWQCK